MLDKTSHPFIVNTLESSFLWDLAVWKESDLWRTCLVYDSNCVGAEAAATAEGTTPAEALDRLEALLAGREVTP